MFNHLISSIFFVFISKFQPCSVDNWKRFLSPKFRVNPVSGLIVPFSDQITVTLKRSLQLLDNKYLCQPCFLHQLVSVVGQEWSSVWQERSSNQTVSYQVTNVLLQNLQTDSKEANHLEQRCKRAWRGTFQLILENNHVFPCFLLGWAVLLVQHASAKQNKHDNFSTNRKQSQNHTWLSRCTISRAR